VPKIDEFLVVYLGMSIGSGRSRHDKFQKLVYGHFEVAQDGLWSSGKLESPLHVPNACFQ
jgi:hypothetical protein